jgi:hypothetical protein
MVDADAKKPDSLRSAEIKPDNSSQDWSFSGFSVFLHGHHSWQAFSHDCGRAGTILIWGAAIAMVFY